MSPGYCILSEGCTEVRDATEDATDDTDVEPVEKIDDADDDADEEIAGEYG